MLTWQRTNSEGSCKGRRISHGGTGQEVRQHIVPEPIKNLAVSDTPPYISKAWNHEPGLAPPRGCHVKLDEKRELISWENKQLLVESVGLGADWAPSIEWKSNLNDLEEDVSAQYQCELVLQRLAVKFGFRYVQVYAVPHRTMAVWDRDPDEADGRFYQRLWPADNHITVRFGFGPDHCSVHGHIFLAGASDGMLDVMPEGMRKHVFYGDDRVVQLWYWSKSDAQ
ncbi:hypothetical protein DL765_004046 [Monosporascus sp. GIB2]|nr:hypothetical protein DL765_004046 [Monosporascus sp. GIB2]